MTFVEMKISEAVCRALRDKEYSAPTPIQEQAIPEALAGRDVLGLAQTGTGKTAAFAIPIIEHLTASRAADAKRRSRDIQALILTPTRELALQIEESFADYGHYTPIRYTVIFGGVNQKPQVDSLRAGTDVLIATPGRLLDLMSQGFVHLDKIKYFVLDEADRMLDMGFIHDIKRILPKLPEERQTMFFSATMPDSINKLSKTILKHPVRVEVTPAASVVDTIRQAVYRVEKPQKKLLLVEILKREEGKSVLVFSRTKHGADNISKILNRKGIACESIHGNKSQNARVRALTNFKEGRSNVIIATDIAARGIDIDQLDLVLNYDMPDVAETYVHRIGRTGRAGHEGRALSFCTSDEVPMLRDIEKLTGNRIPLLKSNLPEMESEETGEALVPVAQPTRQDTRGDRKQQRATGGSSTNGGGQGRERKKQSQRASKSQQASSKPQQTPAKPRAAVPERRRQHQGQSRKAEPTSGNVSRNASKAVAAEPRNKRQGTETSSAKAVERLRSRFASTRGYE